MGWPLDERRERRFNEPQFGSFIDGEGVLVSEADVDGVRWLYRGVWDQITLNTCHWRQSASKDSGESFSWNWWMEWTRKKRVWSGTRMNKAHEATQVSTDYIHYNKVIRGRASLIQ